MTRHLTELNKDAKVKTAIAEYFEAVDHGERVDIREFFKHYGDLSTTQIESMVRVCNSLAELPTDQREAFRMLYIEALPLAQVAERMQRSVVSAGVLAKKGAAMLSRLIGK